MSALEEGKRLLAKAQEYSKPKLLSFRFSPDWESAARYARQAAEKLTSASMTNEAAFPFLEEALEMSAQASDQINSPNQAARDYEALAKIHRNKGRHEKAWAAFEKAARYYRLNNQIDTAASALVQAAKVADEAKNSAECTRLYNLAVSIYEDEEEKAISSESTFKAAINYLVNAGRYAEARQMITRQNVVYRRKFDVYAHEIHFNYLSTIILFLHEDKLPEASQFFDSVTYNDNFAGSNPFECARALISTLDSEPEKLDEIRQRYSAALTAIDAPVSRLAYRLDPTRLKTAGLKRQQRRDEIKSSVSSTNFDAVIDAKLGGDDAKTQEPETGAVDAGNPESDTALAETAEDALNQLM